MSTVPDDPNFLLFAAPNLSACFCTTLGIRKRPTGNKGVEFQSVHTHSLLPERKGVIFVMNTLTTGNFARTMSLLNSRVAFSSSKSNNWKDEFDPEMYLRSRYPCPGTVKNHFAEFLLRCLHQFQTKLSSSSINSDGIRVLEYGCGPVPIHTASFAKQASEVVLAEYLEQNRDQVKKWLIGDKSSFNWTPYIEYLVRTLEGHAEESAVSARERRIKEVVKAVVPCNIQDDPPIEYKAEGGYDIILSTLTVEAGTRTSKEYLDAVQKLAHLLKPGGNLLLFSGNWESGITADGEARQGYYTVGDSIFYNVAVTRELVSHALKRCGGCDLHIDEIDIVPGTYEGIQSDLKGFIFASAKYL